MILEYWLLELSHPPSILILGKIAVLPTASEHFLIQVLTGLGCPSTLRALNERPLTKFLPSDSVCGKAEKIFMPLHFAVGCWACAGFPRSISLPLWPLLGFDLTRVPAPSHGYGIE